MGHIKEAYENCPRFKRCSVNKCPLDSHYPDRESIAGDKERKCGQSKARRVKLAEGFNLKYGGLTVREYNAKLRYNALSKKEKEALKEQGKAGLKAVEAQKAVSEKAVPLKTAPVSKGIQRVTKAKNKVDV